MITDSFERNKMALSSCWDEQGDEGDGSRDEVHVYEEKSQIVVLVNDEMINNEKKESVCCRMKPSNQS